MSRNIFQRFGITEESIAQATSITDDYYPELDPYFMDTLEAPKQELREYLVPHVSSLLKHAQPFYR